MSALEVFDDLSVLDDLAGRFEVPEIEPDPVKWAKDTLKVDLWSKQREILRLIDFGVPKLAVPSCNDSGKSFISSVVTARFISKHIPGTARVITTALVGDQVRGVLWNEINQLHERARDSDGKPLLPGRVNQTEWWIGGYMAGIGRKPSDNELEETFAGFHAEYILIIVDEAGGAPDGMWTGVDTLATNIGAQILAIGNPTDPSAEFKRICDGTPDRPGPAHGWEVIRIRAWDTPNLSGEVVPPKLRRVLLDKDWVEDKRIKWGEDDPRWQSRIEAEFPLESQMAVIRFGDVLVAQQGFTVDGINPSTGFEDVQLGVDIAASETGDETVIRERRGRRILRRWSCQSGEPEVVSDLIVQAQMESNATLIHIDATGVGFGFVGDVRRRIPHVAVLPFVAAAAAKDRAQFENRRAEAHWTTRERLRRRELDFSNMENGDETVSQLTSIRYRIKKGRIVVELKEDVRKRIGRSPDDSDALLLSVLNPEGRGVPAPATVHAASLVRQRAEAAHEAQQQALVDTALHQTGPQPVSERIEPATGRGLGRYRRPRTLRSRG